MDRNTAGGECPSLKDWKAETFLSLPVLPFLSGSRTAARLKRGPKKLLSGAKQRW